MTEEGMQVATSMSPISTLGMLNLASEGLIGRLMAEEDDEG